MEMSKPPSAPNIEEFKEHLFNFNKYGYTLMSLVLGYDLGLFDVLNEANRPLTSSEIADRSGMKERYIKEWLGSMTAAKVISIQEENGVHKYNLPHDYFDIVMANVALGKGVGECVRRTREIEACFRKDGPMGDPCAFDGDFWKFFGEFRTECLITKHVQHELFPKLESVDGLHDLLVTGCQVLDIGCGTGGLTMAFGTQYPNSSFTGIDVVDESISDANSSLQGNDIQCNNVTFQLASTTDLVKTHRERFDVIWMSQVLHNLPDPLKMIKEVEGLLKQHGKLVLSEMKLHSNHARNVGDMGAALQFSFSQFFCLPLSMSEKPHEGYGMGWGTENLLIALDTYFALDVKFELEDSECLFVLTKK